MNNPTEPCVIVQGSISDGFTFTGPFPSQHAANDWAEAQGIVDSSRDDEPWDIIALVTPEPVASGPMALTLNTELQANDRLTGVLAGYGATPRTWLVMTVEKDRDQPAASVIKLRSEHVGPTEALTLGYLCRLGFTWERPGA